MCLCMTMFGVVVASGLTEMPSEPSLDQLCADSIIVVSGRAIRMSPGCESLNGAAYALVDFEPIEVFKGRADLVTARPSGLHLQPVSAAVFSVLITTRRPDGCYRVPSYVPGSDYLLFLGMPCAFAVYGRAQLDSIWAEHHYTDTLGSRVRSVVKEQASFRLCRWRNPGDLGAIPAEAQEHVETLTEQDKVNGYSRKVYYTIGERRVGERGWWASGRLAYERPILYGRNHGLVRGWYPDGALWEERHYRHGHLHGLVRQWDANGDLTVSLWLDGQSVTSEAYKQECDRDPALPRYPQAESKPR